MLTVRLPLPNWELLKDRATSECLAVPMWPGRGRTEGSGAPPVEVPLEYPEASADLKCQQARTRHHTGRQAGRCRLGQGWARRSLKLACLTLLCGRDRCACHPGRPLPRVGRVSGQIIMGCFAAALLETLPVSITALHPPRHPAPCPRRGSSCHYCWSGLCGPRSYTEGETEGPPQAKAAPFSFPFWRYVLGLRLGSACAPLSRASCCRVGLGFGSQGAGS